MRSHTPATRSDRHARHLFTAALLLVAAVVTAPAAHAQLVSGRVYQTYSAPGHFAAEAFHGRAIALDARFARPPAAGLTVRVQADDQGPTYVIPFRESADGGRLLISGAISVGPPNRSPYDTRPLTVVACRPGQTLTVRLVDTLGKTLYQQRLPVVTAPPALARTRLPLLRFRGATPLENNILRLEARQADYDHTLDRYRAAEAELDAATRDYFRAQGVMDQSTEAFAAELLTFADQVEDFRDRRNANEAVERAVRDARKAEAEVNRVGKKVYVLPDTLQPVDAKTRGAKQAFKVLDAKQKLVNAARKTLRPRTPEDKRQATEQTIAQLEAEIQQLQALLDQATAPAREAAAQADAVVAQKKQAQQKIVAELKAKRLPSRDALHNRQDRIRAALKTHRETAAGLGLHDAFQLPKATALNYELAAALRQSTQELKTIENAKVGHVAPAAQAVTQARIKTLREQRRLVLLGLEITRLRIDSFSLAHNALHAIGVPQHAHPAQAQILQSLPTLETREALFIQLDPSVRRRPFPTAEQFAAAQALSDAQTNQWLVDAITQLANRPNPDKPDTHDHLQDIVKKLQSPNREDAKTGLRWLADSMHYRPGLGSIIDQALKQTALPAGTLDTPALQAIQRETLVPYDDAPRRLYTARLAQSKTVQPVTEALVLGLQLRRLETLLCN
ncbi:MAG: hypothetical protein AAF797_10115 [Planctomycetota bacterium]